jgi:hypothetical protein
LSSGFDFCVNGQQKSHADFQCMRFFILAIILPKTG